MEDFEQFEKQFLSNADRLVFLNQSTALALGKVAHIEDTLEWLELEAKQLLVDTKKASL